MLNICNRFSCSNGLIFNATKTMYIQFHYGKHSDEIPQYPVYIGLDKHQWYSKVKHLDHILIVVQVFQLMWLIEMDSLLVV